MSHILRSEILIDHYFLWMKVMWHFSATLSSIFSLQVVQLSNHSILPELLDVQTFRKVLQDGGGLQWAWASTNRFVFIKKKIWCIKNFLFWYENKPIHWIKSLTKQGGTVTSKPSFNFLRLTHDNAWNRVFSAIKQRQPCWQLLFWDRRTRMFQYGNHSLSVSPKIDCYPDSPPHNTDRRIT